MNNNLTEIVFILDRSGSMAGLEDDTVGGFNAMVEKQKKEPGEALLSAVLFSDESEVLYDRVDLRRVEPMTERQYRVGGCTALLDAIGGAVHHIANVHKYAREEDRPGKTIFVITTDGMENASRAYRYDEVRRMVKHEQEKHGWEFLFLGANMDAISAARSFGIRPDRAVRYARDSAGTALNYQVVSETVASFRARKEIASTFAVGIPARSMVCPLARMAIQASPRSWSPRRKRRQSARSQSRETVSPRQQTQPIGSFPRMAMRVSCPAGGRKSGS